MTSEAGLADTGSKPTFSSSSISHPHPPTLFGQSVSRGSGGQHELPPTQRAPRHVSQLPAEARPQRQSINSFALRLLHTWRLVRQSLAAYLAVSTAWYNMHGNHALPITDFYAACVT
ncbi:hypothetical protein EDB83DRAFT_2521934 [Lactarius deliciosus]|nr:hypothetical protein EDB83DRAFT_2521934 [Lactarius deliciosus]